MGSCKSFDRERAETLAVIPARGGSKGLPRKCGLPVGGVPLLVRAISTAKAARCVSRTIVSTDDPEFAALAEKAGAEVPFLRPPELAGDATPIIDAIEHLLESLRGAKAMSRNTGSHPGDESASLPRTSTAPSRPCSRAGPRAVSVCESEVKPDWLRRVGADGFIGL
jgi:N-acylneuraminate cytidylyltransferase